MTNQHPAPVRIRPAIGDAIGTTAFFRNRILNETLLSELLKAGHKKYSVLFHACSIGAEVYSFIIQYLERGLDKNFALTCQALDKQQEFLDFARAAQFPPEILSGCSINEKTYFIELNKQVSPINKVQNYVEFLPANDFLSFTSETDFDVVFLLNALVYVPDKTQAEVIDRVASYNDNWLITTGFHSKSIKADLQRNKYTPIETAIEEIHMGWTDRMRSQAVLPKSLPPNIFTDWSLRPFSKVADYEYKYCALFKK